MAHYKLKHEKHSKDALIDTVPNTVVEENTETDTESLSLILYLLATEQPT